MIITIMGTPCAGKTTVARLVAQKLGFAHYSVGNLRRDAAKERGMTLAEFNKLGESGDTDTVFDEYLENLGKTQDDFVVDCRMGGKVIPHAFKIYLDADITVRAQRMVADAHHQETQPARTVEEAKKVLLSTLKSDKRRYLQHYNYDPYNAQNYDIVIDTTNKSLTEVVAIILDKVTFIK